MALRDVRIVTIIVLLALCLACGRRNPTEAEARRAVADLTAPVEMPPHGFEEVMEAWNWRVSPRVQPLLITALGDVFVQSTTGEVQFLDTESGQLERIALSREDWLRMLTRSDFVEKWFRPSFVRELKTEGKPLKPGEVYSPTAPLALSGQLTTENYTPRSWQGHLHVLGHIHRQVKDLPEGTKITKIHVEPW